MPTLFYSFSDLQTDIWSSAFTVSNTENVSVVLTQSGLDGAADLNYSLTSCNGCTFADYGPIPVNAEYTSTSDTITFPNVSPGTYYLWIHNDFEPNIASGNGWIYY